MHGAHRALWSLARPTTSPWPNGAFLPSNIVQQPSAGQMGGFRPEGSIDPPPPPGNENPASPVTSVRVQKKKRKRRGRFLCNLVHQPLVSLSHTTKSSVASSVWLLPSAPSTEIFTKDGLRLSVAGIVCVLKDSHCPMKVGASLTAVEGQPTLVGR